jgi:hypothetical protein
VLVKTTLIEPYTGLSTDNEYNITKIIQKASDPKRQKYVIHVQLCQQEALNILITKIPENDTIVPKVTRSASCPICPTPLS